MTDLSEAEQNNADCALSNILIRIKDDKMAKSNLILQHNELTRHQCSMFSLLPALFSEQSWNEKFAACKTNQEYIELYLFQMV